jgi:hypothetical protein
MEFSPPIHSIVLAVGWSFLRQLVSCDKASSIEEEEDVVIISHLAELAPTMLAERTPSNGRLKLISDI